MKVKVTLQGMDQKRLDLFKETLKNTYKASDADIDSLLLSMNGMKTSMGKTIYFYG